MQHEQNKRERKRLEIEAELHVMGQPETHDIDEFVSVHHDK